MMGLPSTARPWDLTGRAPDTDLDWLLASLEAAEAAGDSHIADATRSRIRYLERRRYGVGLEPLSAHRCEETTEQKPARPHNRETPCEERWHLPP